MHRIAIIGAGRMAEKHLEALSRIPEMIAVGIFSRTASKSKHLAEQHNIEFVASSIFELFDLTQAMAVIIAVNEPSTEEVCIEAMNFPWKILVEKPVGLNTPSLDRIVSHRCKTRSEVFVAMNRRQYFSVLSAVAELENCKNKRLVQICDQEDPAGALANGRDKKTCENWHFANSIHLIDLFYVFCRGAVVDVKNIIAWKSGFESKFTHSIISFSSGDIGIYHSIWNAPGPWSVSVETDIKRLELRPIERLSVQHYSEKIPQEIKEKLGVASESKPGFYNQLIEFRKQLQCGISKLPTIDIYKRTAELTDMLYQDNAS